jgi:hypothetical protein
MNGYNPNESMIPASGGNIVAMSGGGVAEQHPNGGGLVFANGGGCSPAIPSNGGGCSPTIPSNGGGGKNVKQTDSKEIENEVIQKLIHSEKPVKNGTYTPQEQDTLFLTLTSLLKSQPTVFKIDISGINTSAK